MASITLQAYDFVIGETKDGNEVVQLKNGFDSDFIVYMKELGVKPRPIRQEENEESEEV